MKTYLFVICIIAVSCRHSDKPFKCISSLNNYVVTFNVGNQKSFPVNEVFNITGKISCNNPENLPSDLLLDVEAIMPEHHHGMNVSPHITLNKDGSFHVEGMLFHMPGRWTLHFYLKKGIVTEAASYEAML